MAALPLIVFDVNETVLDPLLGAVLIGRFGRLQMRAGEGFEPHGG
jgi:hypothetical protein